jgi:hypothetical protein
MEAGTEAGTDAGAIRRQGAATRRQVRRQARGKGARQVHTSVLGT